jgi:glycosyltransferase involved in cell wall biosynthesis
MHLAVLTQYYPPEIGAPQARLSDLASHFVRRGHTVTVLTAVPSYPVGKIYPGYRGLRLIGREQQDGIDVIRTLVYPTQKTDLVHRLANYFSFVLGSATAGSLLLKPPDYLLVESPPLFLGLVGVWLSVLKRTRLIFNVSDLWPESAVRLGVLREGSVSFQLSSRLEGFCYRRAWLVTGQTKTILSNIIKRFPKCRTFHLSNGVDTKRFRRVRSSLESAADSHGNGNFVALYAGLHGIAQGLGQVLDAAEVLCDREAMRFLFVGDGPEKKRLMQQAEERGIRNVQFLHPRSAQEVPGLLATADALLVPLGLHLPGAVPSKLYEAMASGRPVVLVAQGEAADIVRNHCAGIIVAPGDIAGLTSALRKLRAEPELCRRMGANGVRAAAKHFDRTNIANQFIDYLESNLRRPSA